MKISSKDISFVFTTDEDWPILLDLEKTMLDNQIYRPIVDMNELKKYFSKNIILKVKIDKKIIGYCAYKPTQKTAEITALLVIKEFRRRGVGELMLKKILSDLKNAKIIKVITSPENTIALEIYRKHGFAIKERLNNYWYGQPRIVLCKINK